MSSSKGAILSCKGIRVRLGDKEIVKGVDMVVDRGEVHAIMGPNGSGKSTLASALMGHPDYGVSGSVLLDGEEVGDAEPYQRARRGLFLGFQYPVGIPGVTVLSFLRAACEAKEGGAVEGFTTRLKGSMSRMGIPWEFAARYINDGFSGGRRSGSKSSRC